MRGASGLPDSVGVLLAIVGIVLLAVLMFVVFGIADYLPTPTPDSPIATPTAASPLPTDTVVVLPDDTSAAATFAAMTMTATARATRTPGAVCCVGLTTEATGEP